MSIHSSAIIAPSAILEGDISIGANTSIGPGCYLKGPLSIGENNTIGAHVMLGVDPEHKTAKPVGNVMIGNNTIIREFSVVQRGTGDRETEIQDNCFLMAYSYVAHDTLIESKVIMSARVSLAGHCHILKGAILGLASSFKEYSTVGAHALIGMSSVVTKDVQPFSVVAGNPAKFKKFNLPALQELNIQTEALQNKEGSLASENNYVQQCITHFQQHVRAKILLNL